MQAITLRTCVFLRIYYLHTIKNMKASSTEFLSEPMYAEQQYVVYSICLSMVSGHL